MNKFFKGIAFGALLGGMSTFTMIATAQANDIKVGFSMGDGSITIAKDKVKYFTLAAKKAHIQFAIADSHNSVADQKKNIGQFIRAGYNVLVVEAVDGDQLATELTNAQAKGIKIVAFDRFISGVPLDALVTVDSLNVGQLQAAYLIQKKPVGNYYLLGGGPGDNNAINFRFGQYFELSDHFKDGIKIIGHSWTPGWDVKIAKVHFNKFLSENPGIQIDAVVASNDDLAREAINLLKKYNYKNVAVSGQDATPDGLQRVLNGTQSMTIYKSPITMANNIMKAVQQVHNNNFVSSRTITPGKYPIPELLFEPKVIDKYNVKSFLKDLEQEKAEVTPQLANAN